jgi:hypothetical protein
MASAQGLLYLMVNTPAQTASIVHPILTLRISRINATLVAMQQDQTHITAPASFMRMT